MVWAALGVRPDEVGAVRGLFCVSFLLGLALVVFYGSSNALFLTNYDIDVLPWVYIVNAVLVVVVGLVYSVASRRFAVHRVLAGSNAFIAISVLGLWLWAATSDAALVSFFMAAWFRLLFIFGFLGLWEVASTIFDVRQAKRLFPPVALGAMLALVLGGALTGVATGLVGTTHMVMVSGIFFAVYAAAFAVVMRAEVSAQSPNSVPPAGPRDIIADRYARLLAAMRSIVILLIFVGEFVFYEQAAATYEDEDSLATFFGVFIAGSTLLMVIVTAALAARYIAHFGLRIGLMTMPAGIGLTAIATALWGTFVGVDAVFFALVVGSMVANTVLSNAIETPVGAVMFQPLPAALRMPVRVAVDGWLGSVALLVAGLLLLAFAAADFDSVVPFTWLLGVLGAVGVWMAHRLHLGYKDALRSATTRAFSGEGRLPINPDESGFDAIATGGPASAFAATAILFAHDDSGTVDPLIDAMLAHPDSTIAEAAILSGSISDASGDDRSRLLASAVARSDLSDDARGHALLSLARVDPRRAEPLARGLQVGSGELLREFGDAVLLGDAVHRPAVMQQLRHGAQAPELARRLSTARVLQRIEGQLPDDVAAQLLIDDAEDVQLQTLRALEGKVTVALAPTVLRAGRSQALRRHAVVALAHSGPEVLDPVAANIASLDAEYQAELIEHVYGRHTRRPAMLHPFVRPEQPSCIRQAGFTAIERADIAPPASPRRMLSDDIELVRRLTSAWRDVSAASPALAWALEAEFAAARSSIYRALSIDHDARRVHDIEAIASHSDGEDRANAIEALDVMMRSELRRQVIPVIEPRTIAEACDELPDLLSERPPHEWLVELAADQRLGSWTTATASHLLDRGQPMSDLLDRIAALKGVDIFSTLPYPLLAELAEGVQERAFGGGETIIAEGALDQELYALTSGSVTVVRGHERSQLEAGTVFGELAVLDPAPRSADVIAATPCSVLIVRRETLLALTDRRPEVMVEIAGVLARRLRAQK